MPTDETKTADENTQNIDWADAGILLPDDIEAGDFIRWKSNQNYIMQGTVQKDTPIEAGYYDYRDWDFVVNIDLDGNRHIAPNSVQVVSERKLVLARHRRWEKSQYVVSPRDVLAVSPEDSSNWYRVLKEDSET